MQERLTEIVEELNKILAELEGMETPEEVEEAEKKVEELKDEKRRIESAIEKRRGILDAVADGSAGKVVKTFSPIKAEKRTFGPESKEYRRAYLLNLQGKPLSVEERAVITASSVIPTETINKIVEKLEQTSALYNRITVTEIPGNVTYPRENAKNDAAWVAMATAATDSADSFDSVSLSAYKLIKTIEIGADVSAMSIDAFESYIVNALAKKMNKAIENAIINGTGTNQPTGLLASGQITNTGTFTKAKMKYGDLMAIIGALPTEYHNNACFVMPRVLFFNDVAGIETTTGAPAIVMDPQSPAKFNVLGYPVIIDDCMAADTIIFGDMSYYALNWAKPIEIKSDDSVAFRTGSTVYRAMALADGKPLLAEAFVKYTRAAA